MENNNSVVFVLKPVSRWQKSLQLLLVLLTLCSAQSTYYVTPTPNTSCPAEPCHTLSQYVADEYFKNLPVNTTMKFLPGNHTLKQPIWIANRTWLTLYGDSSYLPEIPIRILCTRAAGLIFTNITELYITALDFISCSYRSIAAVTIIHVQLSKISNCSFHNSYTIGYDDGFEHSGYGGALFILNSSVILTANNFQHNSAKFGAAICMVESKSTITRNTFKYNSAEHLAGVLYITSSTLILSENKFQNNSAKWGGAIHMLNSSSIITGNIFMYNSAEYPGGALSILSSTLILRVNIFQDNSAYFGGALVVHLSTLVFKEMNIIENNRAQYGGGIGALNSQIGLIGNTSFEGNTATYGGGLYVYETKVGGNMTLAFSSAEVGGGGVYAALSIFSFIGKSIIKNNIALNGGGLLLSSESKFYLQPKSHVYFTNNSAKHTGGAIKVEESNPLAYCSSNLFQIPCFFQIKAPTEECSMGCEQYISDLNVSITFDSNSAEVGADLHGGAIEHCAYFSNTETMCFKPLDCPASGKPFDNITSSETTPDVSSDPLYLCTCRDNLTDCTGSYHHPEPVYPGGTLEVPVIAHGQRNGMTPAVIQIINKYNSSVTFEKQDNVQNADNRCTTLTYTIHSYEESTTKEITLYAKGPCLPTDTSRNILRVLIDILHCPPGFQISKNHPKCVCAERLQKFTNTCLVDDKVIFQAQDARFWVGYDSTSQGLILHPHCPFDYCTSEETHLSVDDSDKQCNYNRSGLLCGQCRDYLSLALGSSNCLQCSNSYLSLLVAFAFAGIVLVLFLLVLRLTVATGTINGLIFYANVVAVNSATFFQPQTTNILTLFIAWFNLDLGFESCFYNGLDAYAKTWLQFVFPLYVWALVGMIILGSYYSGKVAKIFGSNPVAVLATLFLLSYAKLLRTVIAALSFTYLEYPNNLQIAVWLYDGNIRYLSGKHIPLFLAAIVCLIFLFFPYTMLLIFSQCLQAKSKWKIFSYVNSRYVTPFLDAYHAPYSSKHRYWTGLMLLFRFVLFLISAVNVLGDPSVNLLAIASATIFIPPTVFGCRIYKTWSLILLEASFIINLAILAVATLYIRFTGGNQNAAMFTSVGIAFVTFTVIIISHSVQQIKGTRLWRRLYLKHKHLLTDVASAPMDPPDTVLVSRSAPTQTVVNICYHELHEPCMETD